MAIEKWRFNMIQLINKIMPHIPMGSWHVSRKVWRPVQLSKHRRVFDPLKVAKWYIYSQLFHDVLWICLDESYMGPFCWGYSALLGGSLQHTGHILVRYAWYERGIFCVQTISQVAMKIREGLWSLCNSNVGINWVNQKTTGHMCLSVIIICYWASWFTRMIVFKDFEWFLPTNVGIQDRCWVKILNIGICVWVKILWPPTWMVNKRQDKNPLVNLASVAFFWSILINKFGKDVGMRQQTSTLDDSYWRSPFLMGKSTISMAII